MNVQRPVQIQEKGNQTVTLNARNSRDYATTIKDLKKLEVWESLAVN